MTRLVAALLACLLTLPAHAEERWVSVGAVITETLFALNAGDRIVGVDETSVYPEAALGLTKVGSHREVSAEAVLALRPTLVVAAAEVGPASAFVQLEAAGVRVVRMPGVDDLPAAKARLRALATLVGEPERGEALVAQIDSALDALTRLPRTPTVAFLYARGAGTLLLAGQGTPVEAVVLAAGGTLAAPWPGFRPITAEAMVASAPELIVLTTRGLQSLGGIDGVLAAPGVALTPAGQARRVVAVDDVVLLTLGPRLGEAAQIVNRSLVQLTARGSTP